MAITAMIAMATMEQHPFAFLLSHAQKPVRCLRDENRLLPKLRRISVYQRNKSI